MDNRSYEETKKIAIESKSSNNQESQTESQHPTTARRAGREKRSHGCGCLILVLMAVLLYFIAPVKTQFLILGIDRAPQGTMAGRSDTIMIVSVNPLLPEVKLLSIPRDLWVPIPGFGENRINAAHFFAEAQQPGTGSQKTLETIKYNFGVELRHYVRINLAGLPALIDAMGGITLNLPQVMAGYPEGTNDLNGDQALAFVRSRSDGDDFFRMRQGQLFIAAFMRQLFTPSTWARFPQIMKTLPQALDTNLPFWQLPRLLVALLRATYTGIDTLTIDRSLVTPAVTSEGAQILLPNWDLILPYIGENF
ncbi:MAG: LytR family transcriptional regulator [Anaerolineaceae bacterium]|jgi:LCP family protein required for cell wall assembly|nr:MAG: LytR family transcriptional regulator [Anaerolineaceae bacterium]